MMVLCGNHLSSGTIFSTTPATETDGSHSSYYRFNYVWARDQDASIQEVSSKRNAGILLNQNIDAYINPQWALMDSKSTDHIFVINIYDRLFLLVMVNI